MTYMTLEMSCRSISKSCGMFLCVAIFFVAKAQNPIGNKLKIIIFSNFHQYYSAPKKAESV